MSQHSLIEQHSLIWLAEFLISSFVNICFILLGHAFCYISRKKYFLWSSTVNSLPYFVKKYNFFWQILFIQFQLNVSTFIISFRLKLLKQYYFPSHQKLVNFPLFLTIISFLLPTQWKFERNFSTLFMLDTSVFCSLNITTIILTK